MKKDEQKPASGNRWIVILLALILFISIAALGISVYVFMVLPKSPKNTASTPIVTKMVESSLNPTLVSTSQPAERKTEIASNKLFYILEDKIYSYDYLTKEIKNWDAGEIFGKAVADKSPYTSIKNLRVIDGKYLGFIRCDGIKGDYGCGIYVLDLSQNTVILKQKVGPKEMLNVADWAGEDTFLYIIDGEEMWKFIFQNKGDKTTLESLPATLAGRGGGRNDDVKVRFSPDKSKVFYIQTASPRNITDYNVYIFDLKTNEKQVITGATQPAWLSNEKIVYRQLTPDIGPYVYDLTAKSSTKIASLGTNSYNPEVLVREKKVLYEMYPEKQIHLFDQVNNQDMLVSNMALSPVWLSSNIIAYEEVAPCPTGGCEEGPGGEILDTKVALYDLSAKQKLGFIPNLTSNWGVASYP